MRREDVYRWLAREVREDRQGAILAGGAAWLPRVVTLQEIGEDLGVCEKTVRRDLEELLREGFVLKKIRQHGLQLGLIQVGQNVQPQTNPGRTKCPTSEPLISSSSSLTNSFSDNLTKGSGIDRGSGGKKRRTRKGPKMQFSDLVLLSDGAAGWNDLEALPRNGFGLCLQERTGVDISRILSIRTSLERSTSWPCTAIVKAARDWTGRDQGGRSLQDPASWLKNAAYWIADEGMRKEWGAYQEERDKRLAEVRGPEAAQIQALIQELAGKMKIPDVKKPQGRIV